MFTCIRPSAKAGIPVFGVLKCRFGGMKPDSMAMTTLLIEHNPEAGSECPIFDLTDPIRRGSFRPLQKILSKALHSSGSPTCQNNNYVAYLNIYLKA